jgi:hypothetical protein
LGSQRGRGDFGEETNNTTTKRGGEESIGKHGIKGGEEGGANQRESGTVELIGETIEARRFVGRSLVNGAS